VDFPPEENRPLNRSVPVHVKSYSRRYTCATGTVENSADKF
jgi:hypothetical protein